MLALEYATCTDIGDRAINQDAVELLKRGEQVLAVVADGAGGHRGGERAAAIVVEQVSQAFRQGRIQPGDSSTLARALGEANVAMVTEQRTRHECSDMRSTAGLLALDLAQRDVAWAHAGDTRLYWFRADRLAFRTTDHSVRALWQRRDEPSARRQLLALGVSVDSAQPPRSQIYSALGSLPQSPVSSHGIAAVLLAGDVFLVCTDGLWEYLPKTVLERTLANACTPSHWLSALRQVAAASAEKVRRDNGSAVALWLKAFSS